MTIARQAGRLVEEAFRDTPVVFVVGPRQAGKSTLARGFLGRGPLARYVTFDDLDVRAAATTDPQGFVAGLGDGAVIDEVQRVPDVVLALKSSVDRDRRPGRFLLTGSANPFYRHEETLAGRREDVALWTLSQAELEGTGGRLVDQLFADDPGAFLREVPAVEASDVIARALRGGYPEVLTRERPQRIDAWYRGYVSEVVHHEVADLAAIEGLLDMPRLLRLVAQRTTGLLNVARLARDAGIPPQTARRYLALLQEAFMVTLIPAWTVSQRKRLVKSPKALVTDSGLASHLADLTAERLPRSPELVGPLVEGFVLTELRRLIDASDTRPTLHHFRTEQGSEVDAVLEDPSGRVVGIEVKARVTVTRRDFGGIEALAEAARSSFHLGLVLHPGDQAVAFGPRSWAVPIAALWS